MIHLIIRVIQGCGGEGDPEDVEGVQDEEAAQGEAAEEAQEETRLDNFKSTVITRQCDTVG